MVVIGDEIEMESAWVDAHKIVYLLPGAPTGEGNKDEMKNVPPQNCALSPGGIVSVI